MSVRSKWLRVEVGLALLGISMVGSLAWGQAPNAPARTTPNQSVSASKNPDDLPADVAELYQDATHASEQGDWTRAARLYAEVMKLAPGFKPARLRYGVMLVLQGKEAAGGKILDEMLLKPDSEPLELAGVARGLERGAAFSKRAGSPLIARYNALAFERAEAAGYAAASDLSKLSMFATLALENRKAHAFRAATAKLIREHPDAKESHYFNAIRALDDKDWAGAENELHRAGELGLPRPVVDRMLASIPGRPSTGSYLSIALGVAAAWIIGLAVLFVAGKFLSMATLRSAQADDPNAAITSSQRILRRLYRMVINLAALYYYLSLPFVAILALGMVAAVGFVVLKMPRIPVKGFGILLIFGFAMLATVWSSVRSLFVRIKDEDPGRVLDELEAPGLWTLVREVAAQVGTRPVDAIYLAPGTELAVYERGRWRDKVRDRAQRTLILGQGVIDGFRQDPFRAVMAHEYGHFLHRDTAGGDVALRVNATIGRFATAMLERGHAAWWNIGWQFVRLYHLLFRRITHGASRLQEINADRVAARAFGKKAFEEGLKHVIHRDVALRYNQAIARRDHSGDEAPIALPPESRSSSWFLRAEVRHQIENDVKQIWNAKTTEDDTHPCPADRIRLIERLKTGPAQGNGDSPASRPVEIQSLPNGQSPVPADVESLFANPAQLRTERAEYLAKDIKDHVEAKKAYCTHLVSQIDAYLAEHPGLSDPVRERANLRIELNDIEGAIQDYSEAIRLDGPNPSLCYFGRGLARRKLGDLAAAATDLRQAIKLDPALGKETANGWVELGEILLELGDPSAAIEEFSRAIEQYEKSTEIDASGLGVYLRRGEAFAAAEDLGYAEIDLSRALEIDPRCAEALAARARIRSAQGRPDDAASDALAAIQIEPALGTLDDLFPDSASASFDRSG